jgi:hypothetical protein
LFEEIEDFYSMNNRYAYWLVCLGFIVNLSALAQLPSNRIRPGTMYYPGDTVRSPRLGLEAIIPPGWDGVLPRDAEVFLLMSAENLNGQIYVGLNENLDQQGQIAKWKQGMELGAGLRLMPGSEITFRGKAIAGTGKVTGQNANTAHQIYL